VNNPDRTAAISLWRDRRFRRFWAGQSVSQCGDRITELALPLIAISALNASANQVAWLTALIWTPNLLAIFLGAWVDHRAHKRRLLILADLVRAAVLLSVPAAYLLAAVTLGQLYAVALLMGTAGVLFNTAYPPFFARLVPQASYVDANSKLSASRSASYVAGPAIGGALIQALTAPVTVVVDALTFLVSAVLVGRVSVDEPSAVFGNAAAPSLLQRAREGLSFVVRHPVLRATLGCAARSPLSAESCHCSGCCPHRYPASAPWLRTALRVQLLMRTTTVGQYRVDPPGFGDGLPGPRGLRPFVGRWCAEPLTIWAGTEPPPAVGLWWAMCHAGVGLVSAEAVCSRSRVAIGLGGRGSIPGAVQLTRRVASRRIPPGSDLPVCPRCQAETRVGALGRVRRSGIREAIRGGHPPPVASPPVRSCWPTRFGSVSIRGTPVVA